MRKIRKHLPHGRKSRPAVRQKKSRTFPLGNALPYIDSFFQVGCVLRGAPFLFPGQDGINQANQTYIFCQSFYDAGVQNETRCGNHLYWKAVPELVILINHKGYPCIQNNCFLSSLSVQQYILLDTMEDTYNTYISKVSLMNTTC